MERSADEIRQGVLAAFRVLMPLIRQQLWHPDGKPPADWDERREGSVVKRLLRHRTVSQIETAILGLVQLRAIGEVPWLNVGDKMTCRALYNSHSGVLDMFEKATEAYWLGTKKRKPQPLPDTVKDVLRKMLA